MKILMVASEMTPLAKTGGLADVLGALPAALAARGHDVAVALPFYGQIPREGLQLSLRMPHLVVELPVARRALSVWSTRVGGVTVYLFDDPPLFHRPELYAMAGREYSDNPLRYAYFCLAALWMTKGVGWMPDVIHAHDWQAALAPIYLRNLDAFRGDPGLSRARVLFTIHNLGYQGVYPACVAGQIGLPASLMRPMRPDGLEFWGQVNLMKGGILASDWISTVSPTYAREIQTTIEFGCGLEGVVRDRADRLTGILNGIDAQAWDPETDPALAANYSRRQPAGKARCKAALQERLGLAIAPRTPLLGIVSRLTDQKGFDLLAKVLPRVLAGDAQLAVLGTGQPEYHKLLQKLAASHPGKVGLKLGFDEALAHQIEAGADLFLMPSRFEPCGLNQMYSLRYGTIPIVRRTGGLADTINDATKAALAANQATGFVFDDYAAPELRDAIDRALALYRDRPDAWKRLMDVAMGRDHSWDHAAAEYEALMTRMLES
jgi:starch synthase